MEKLTDKMNSFCEEYVANGFNGSKAYQKAYSQKSKNIAAAEAYKLLQDSRILNKIREIQGSYELIGLKLGIDRKLIMKKVAELLEAKRVVYSQGSVVGEDPDNTAINNAIITYAKLTGGFEPEKTTIKIEENEVDVSKMTEKEKEELRTKILSTI